MKKSTFVSMAALLTVWGVVGVSIAAAEVRNRNPDPGIVWVRANPEAMQVRDARDSTGFTADDTLALKEAEEIIVTADPESGGQSVQTVHFIPHQADGETLSTEWLGAEVLGPDGASVARVSDLLIDPTNEVAAVVLSRGGLLGFGAKKIAVPRNELEVRSADGEQTLVARLTAEELDQAPEFKPAGSDERDGPMHGWFNSVFSGHSTTKAATPAANMGG